MTKPREWWIIPPEHKHKDVIDVTDFKPAHPDHIHVVEYAAYQKLEQELAKALHEIERSKKLIEIADSLITNDEAIKDWENVKRIRVM